MGLFKANELDIAIAAESVGDAMRDEHYSKEIHGFDLDGSIGPQPFCDDCWNKLPTVTHATGSGTESESFVEWVTSGGTRRPSKSQLMDQQILAIMPAVRTRNAQYLALEQRIRYLLRAEEMHRWAMTREPGDISGAKEALGDFLTRAQDEEGSI